LQTETIDVTPILPAVIVSILIFLVILVNEFPDLKADAAVSKKTLVVFFGVLVSVWIYRIVLVASFVIAAVMLIYGGMFYAGLFYLFTLPVAVVAIRFVNKKDLTTPGKYRASQITVILHALGSLALTAGFVVSSLFKPLF
jgi:1,4-dihydroxy-2-naphthoate octaprenyltransferase